MTAVIVAVGILGLSAVIATSVKLTAVNRETARARQAGNMMLEEIRTYPVSEVYARFNSDPKDDPEAGSPGETFEVPTVGLSSVMGAMIGTIEFPTSAAGVELCETTKDAMLGMPMDLNGDGSLDDASHATDYVLLPIRIRVTWRGIAGERAVEMYAVLRDETHS
jgi:hypothetical protein